MAKRLPAEKWHVSKKAKMINFAGFFMPISYSSIIEEHLAVRNRAGFFDISHMGEILVKGVDAASWLNNLTCNDVFKLNPGKAQYSIFLNERGGVIDDIIIYMLAVDEFLIVVNAANTEKDFNWLRSNLSGSLKIYNVSEEFGLVAIAGREALNILGRIFPQEALPNSFFHFKKAYFKQKEIIISATGYTGEKTTFEIFIPADLTADFLETLYIAGSEYGALPCGLGARDSLRIEAGLPLYGQELKEDRTPFESDLSWVVKLKKPGDFIGKKSLLEQLDKGYNQKIGYFVLESQGPIPRTGYRVFSIEDQPIGEVTSGSYSPLLQKPIFMAFVEKDKTLPGTQVQVEIRAKKYAARAVEKPFLKL
jgi:aminomethyltransferase